MFCPNCGTSLTEGARFCPNCGAQISAGTAPAANATPTPNANMGAAAGAGFAPSAPSGAAAKRSKVPFVIAGAAIVAVVALGIAFFATGGFGLLGPKAFRGTLELTTPQSSISFVANVTDNSLSIETRDGHEAMMSYRGTYDDPATSNNHVVYHVDNLEVVPYNNFTVLNEMTALVPLGFEEGNLAGQWALCFRGDEDGESILQVMHAFADEDGKMTVYLQNRSAYDARELDIYDPSSDAFNAGALTSASSAYATGSWRRVSDGTFQLDLVDHNSNRMSFTLTVSGD